MSPGPFLNIETLLYGMSIALLTIIMRVTTRFSKRLDSHEQRTFGAIEDLAAIKASQVALATSIDRVETKLDNHIEYSRSGH